MRKLSNFWLQHQEQYNINENNNLLDNTDFIASGADQYFREYNYSETYFSDNREIYYGAKTPVNIKRGIPIDDEATDFDTFYTYPKMDKS